MKIISITTAIPFRHNVNFETSSRAPGCLLLSTNINIMSTAIGYHCRTNVTSTPIIDIILWILSVNNDLTICPPSKNATGIRLSNVTIIPTHPANTSGCICSAYPAGIGGNIKYINMVIIGGFDKFIVWDAIGTIFDRCIPIISTGIATIIPAKGPLNPRSNKEFLSGIGDLTLITAPNVPINVGAGIK